MSKLTKAEQEELLLLLQERFEKNMKRHKGLDWNDVQPRLTNSPAKLKSLQRMEESGGEPDVVGYDKNKDQFIFVDCSAETPKDRRSICYDLEALESRKANKPANAAMHMAEEMGIDMLTEEEYRDLQKLGEFDLKTSSWVKTPKEVRDLGGAIFCDRRYDRVFTYHNGAESYYAVRGFRGSLRV